MRIRSHASIHLRSLEGHSSTHCSLHRVLVFFLHTDMSRNKLIQSRLRISCGRHLAVTKRIKYFAHVVGNGGEDRSFSGLPSAAATTTVPMPPCQLSGAKPVVGLMFSQVACY